MFTPRRSYEMTSVPCFNRGSISYESPLSFGNYFTSFELILQVETILTSSYWKHYNSWVVISFLQVPS